MIFRDALRSLKDGKANAVFFGLSFYLTTTLLFLFFNMAESAKTAESEIYLTNGLADIMKLLENGNIGNILMVIVVIICAADLFFSNDFFVKNKAKELGIRLISGATYIQLAGYLLVQTFLLILISVPLGIMTGYGGIHLFNGILSSQSADLSVGIHSYAMVEFTTVILFIIFWATLLNMSFAYKSGAALLFSKNIQAVMKKESTFGSFAARFKWLTDAAGIIFAVFPLYLIYTGSGTGIYILLGCVGMYHTAVSVLPGIMTSLNRKRGTKDTVKVVSTGFVRSDIQVSGITIILIPLTLGIFLGFLTARSSDPVQFLLIYMAYGFTAVMQAMALMFRLNTVLAQRKKEYVKLDQLGYSLEQRKAILNREMRSFFLFVLCVCLLYLGTAVHAAYLNGNLTIPQASGLVGFIIVPLAAVYLLTQSFYRNIVFSSGKDIR